MDPSSVKVPVFRRLADSSVVKAAAAIVLVFAAIAAFSTWDEPAEADAPLAVATSFQGVRLGQPFAAAASTHGPFEKEAVAVARKKYDDEVTYVQKNGALRLSVRNGIVTSISYPCREGDKVVLNNIACHHFEDRIRRVFGERVRVLCARVDPDNPNKDIAPYVRAYDVVEYGTRYVVIKDVVQGFTVTDPKELESLVGYNWLKCG